ncbi:hypothetical protein CPJCM30710_22460 [Clostridium polyendosporum]|uniref:Spo0E like sporulation regulatory protein n=1 Tax=Clostridium polyendosporum TaxID=69208 RepID=A0A919VGP1_9CLOT|nr:Spo0E family sporulation regulatory protein-aspartic acid phosphatase [Clostridium polyendosporum]GIM29580.1 hypothetical protein CPJCM30710_22460 [Clostridium polyendosporum]
MSKLEKRIKRRKAILNFCLRYLKPNNRVIIALSQNLDELLVRYQQILLRAHIKKNTNSRLWSSQIA